MNQTHPTIEQLIDYAHGEVSPHEDASIHAHLAACPQCARDYDAENQVTELLRSRAREQERELPPGLITAIYANAHARPAATSWFARLTAAVHPAAAVPVAAIVALAIYFASTGWHANARSSALDAAYYMENHAALATTMPFEEGDAVPTMFTSDSGAR
jgi:anti-sigma factor (TIGR02949 family)